MNMLYRKIKQMAKIYKFLKRYVLKFFIVNIRNIIAKSSEDIANLALVYKTTQIKKIIIRNSNNLEHLNIAKLNHIINI